MSSLNAEASMMRGHRQYAHWLRDRSQRSLRVLFEMLMHPLHEDYSTTLTSLWLALQQEHE